MRNAILFIFPLMMLESGARAQSSFEMMASLGTVNTQSMSYLNCTGHFSQSQSALLSLIYHPVPFLGIELDLSGFSPNTYLYDAADERVQAYTHSTVKIQRLQGGLNYSYPFKKIRPYIGCLIGFSRAATSDPVNTGYYSSFTWTIQTGVDYYFSSLIGLRLKGALITTPDVPDNSAYFNVNGMGDGFPTFALVNPSTANIRQWGISLGIIFRFMKGAKSK
jgi:hypothetical protein